MKNISILALVQAILALICGILMSKMSFIGRMGINFLHRDYLIFKTWWKTAILIFAIQLILILILVVARSLSPSKVNRLICILFVVFGLIGAYATYIDFTTTTHKMMKGSFHSGGYLFWFGWLISCSYFLFSSTKKKVLLSQLPISESPSASDTKNQ